MAVSADGRVCVGLRVFFEPYRGVCWGLWLWVGDDARFCFPSRPWSRKESIFQPGYSNLRGGPHSIQSNQVGPRLRGGVRGRGRAAASRRPPSLDSLQTWPPPPPPNSLPYFYLLLPPDCSLPRSISHHHRDGIRRQADSSPSSLEQGGRQAPAAVQRARLSTHLGSQPAIPFPPPASPAIHSQSQEDIDRAGQGRAEQITDTSSSSKSLAESD